ncbi:MAG: methyltransferase domain-containing protein [Hyphomicrobiales bacterium]
MDITALETFYKTPLGILTRRLIARKLQAHIRRLRGTVVLGLGYGAPYLDALREQADRVLCFMLACQGATQWPPSAPGATALVDEAGLPLPDGSIDCVFVVHGLEFTGNPQKTLHGVWRALKPSGWAVVIVPNRYGLWRCDHTPFGRGLSFSPRQITQILRDAMLTPCALEHALFVPPFKPVFFRRHAAVCERIGSWALPAFSGVMIVEAVKQIHATGKPAPMRGLIAGLKPRGAPTATILGHGACRGKRI